LAQPGKVKADAVFTAFDAARGDVLMILDADLTVPPEQSPTFWHALASMAPAPSLNSAPPVLELAAADSTKPWEGVNKNNTQTLPLLQNGRPGIPAGG
jgi:hypothetical protein